jgi:capsular exopolysaccharide synthesis family protein
MRKPRLHKIFNLENQEGFSTYLAGASGIKIHAVPEVENLHILTAGPTPPNPSELLGSDRLHALINPDKDRFDVTFFDSPPVLTVSDSLILARFLEGTIIVARAGKTSYEIMEKGLSVLANIHAPLLGIIINAIMIRKSDYYYYHHYYHSYYSEDKQ